MNYLKLSTALGLLACALLTLQGCTQVLPRQRGNLALPQMALTPRPLRIWSAPTHRV